MRGRRRIFGLAALLSVLLAVPLVFSLGIIEFPNFSSGILSSTASVFVDPDKIIKDYVLDPGYQIGDTFTVHVNISDVTDLFTWQINLGWDPDILNMSNIIAGEFLARAYPENTSSEELGWVVNSTDYAIGYSASAETILGNVTGITEEDIGRLVSIEFLIVGYGWTDLNISLSGTLPTTLLDSNGSNMTFTTVDGYFSNKIIGDVDGDGDVDWVDFSDFAWAYGSKGPPQVLTPDPKYNRQADLDLDGDVDWVDFSDFAWNYGRSIVLP